MRVKIVDKPIAQKSRFRDLGPGQMFRFKNCTQSYMTTESKKHPWVNLCSGYITKFSRDHWGSEEVIILEQLSDLEVTERR